MKISARVAQGSNAGVRARIERLVERVRAKRRVARTAPAVAVERDFALAKPPDATSEVSDG